MGIKMKYRVHWKQLAECFVCWNIIISSLQIVKPIVRFMLAAMGGVQ